MGYADPNFTVRREADRITVVGHIVYEYEVTPDAVAT